MPASAISETKKAPITLVSVTGAYLIGEVTRRDLSAKRFTLPAVVARLGGRR